MVANILLVGRLPPKGHISTFSEHGHVANQIKGNHECSNMVANILLTDPQSQPLWSKGQNSIFKEHSHVAYQIKGSYECSNRGIKNAAAW